MGFSYDALHHILYLARCPMRVHFQWKKIFLQTMKQEEKSWNMPQTIFANRFKRAVSQQKYWKSSQMIKLALGYGGQFPPAHVYSRFLPQDLLEDAFHPDSLSF